MFVFASSLASAQQATIDPQSLLGQCNGTWKYKTSTGGWFLTLTRLENGIYYGGITYSGAERNTPVDLTGKLEGDIFKYSSPSGSYAELKVEGDKMTGTGGGRTTTGVEISCQKKK